MGVLSILLLMILCHIIDDFVLQSTCLTKLKQKEWWIGQNGYKDLYKNDYKMALAVHSMSWSIMVLLPLIFFSEASEMALFGMFIANAIIHYITDDAKANKGKINLVTDQCIHLLQVLMAWSLCWSI
jgi:hypothetical protein